MKLLAFATLAMAALLEVGGDALIRTGLHAQLQGRRLGLIALGGLVLTAYGLFVNTPGWNFGRLLGVYVGLFFLAAQLVDLVVFHVRPGPPVLAGGALIVAGGLVMTLWR